MNFTVYTMAMTGLICFAVFVYKKVMGGSIRKDNSKFLSVEESMSLSPRKTLHVVRAGNEKFLIASDVDRTTLISKLGDKTLQVSQDISHLKEETFEQTQGGTQFETMLDEVKNNINEAPAEQTVRRNRQVRRRDRSVVALDFSKPAKSAGSPMQEMAKKINEL